MLILTRTTLALACALTAPALAAQAASGATTSAPEIASSGKGTVLLNPDRVHVTLAVVTRAPSAAEAGRLNALQFQRLVTALNRQGLPDSTLTTLGYSVAREQAQMALVASPVSDRPYVAQNAISVSLSRLALLGQILDTALAAGATDATNIVFTSSEAVGGRKRAIALAVRSAQEDALAAATAAGGTLGRLIDITILEEYDGVTAYGSAVNGGTASGPRFATTAIRPRDVSVVARVRARFEFVLPR